MLSRRSKLRGTTLVEMSVVMIVAGIVLLIVMEGFALFRRYTGDLVGRITENSRFYDGYYRLGELATGADSITGDDGKAVCWQGGVPTELVLCDSQIIARYGDLRDTLMHGAGALRVEEDSLVVIVRGLKLTYRK